MISRRPRSPIVANQITMIGPNSRPMRSVPRRCIANRATRIDERAGHDEPLHGRVDDREALDRAQHRDRRRDQRVAIEERRAEHREQHQPLRGLAVAGELVLDQRDQRQHAALALVVHRAG